MKIFSVCSHLGSVFCQLTTRKSIILFHVLIDRSEATTTYDEIFKRNKAFPVSCPFTTFRYLFSSAVDLGTEADVFFKLKLAVDFNIKRLSPHQQCGSVYQQFLHHHNSSKPKLLETQTKIMKILRSQRRQRSGRSQCTTWFCRASKLKQTISVVKLCVELKNKTCPHSGAFCQIIDIFVSRNGNLNNDNYLLFVRFVYEEKFKYWTNWISFKH